MARLAWVGHSTAGDGVAQHSRAQNSTAQWCSQLTLSWRVGGGASASLPVLLPAGPRASPRPSLPRTPRPPLPAPGGAQKPGLQCWAWPHSAGSPCSVSCPTTGLPKTWKLSLLPPKNHMSGKLHSFFFILFISATDLFFPGGGEGRQKLDIKYLIKSQNQPLVSRHS